MAKRSTKFYRKNEAEVMESIGLTPTKNSGAGWVEKSDGQSDHIICELKSTDAQSYRIRLEDLHTLEYNASVCHKIPVFAVQFLGTKEVYLLVKPESLSEAAKYLETGEYTTANEFVGVDLSKYDKFSITIDHKHSCRISCYEGYLAYKLLGYILRREPDVEKYVFR